MHIPQIERLGDLAVKAQEWHFACFYNINSSTLTEPSLYGGSIRGRRLSRSLIGFESTHGVVRRGRRVWRKEDSYFGVPAGARGANPEQTI